MISVPAAHPGSPVAAGRFHAGGRFMSNGEKAGSWSFPLSFGDGFDVAFSGG